MRRRDLIEAIGCIAIAWPLAVRAQQPAMPVVGFVSSRSVDGSARHAAAFSKGLSEAGYVRRRVAVIAALGDPPTLAAKAATATIPIAFGISADPVGHGLVASLARPGGNATGINFFTTEVATKRLGLLHELAPKAVRFALLVNPTNTASTESTLRDVPEAARSIGLQIQILNASTSREIEAAFATIVRDRADALFVGPDGSSIPDACNLRRSRRAMGFPQPMPLARLSKPVG
jgi:putative ABC transport system substrate-binding protein